MPPPLPVPGWIYVLTCPDFAGCVKIGGTSRTATHRAGELVSEYGTAAKFRIRARYPVSDWRTVELAAHRMLSDFRVPRSELFQCSHWQARRTIKAAARAYDRPSLFRRLLLPKPVLVPSRRRYGSSRRLRGTNGIPLLLVCRRRSPTSSSCSSTSGEVDGECLHDFMNSCRHSPSGRTFPALERF